MMGRRNRVRIPECVVRFIRSISPSDDGQYTGHRDGDGDECDDNNNEDGDDLVNSSFHEIEDEASPKIVDFEGGQSIRLSLHFKSSQYNAEHVRQIVLESPIEGWQVSYHEELLTTATFLCQDESTYKTLSMFCFGKTNECTKFTSSIIG
jgi:hypothetical protein